MLCEKQIHKMLEKLVKFEDVLYRAMFEKADEVAVMKYETKEPLNDIPDISLFSPIGAGEEWGEEWAYAWFTGRYAVPDALDGKDIYLYPKLGGHEGMYFVDGRAMGTFCSNVVVMGHGNHYCNLIRKGAKAGEAIDIALEYYAGHFVIGSDPWNENKRGSYRHTYNSVDIYTKNEEISDFYFDLKTLNQVAARLSKDDFRRGAVVRTLAKAHEMLYYAIDDVSRDIFMDAIRAVSPLLKKEISKTNSESAPYMGIIGHSHMDTAWLWHMGETRKKCARTYSNQLTLMDQYPEYIFIQSSTYHSEMIRQDHPELFERIRERVAEGRYEPNGGVWIECDCNITSGESMIRQFLWGQRFTRKYFGYTADCFWLPDTFGYSASIPQIMKGCEVDYFLTTKISWNDTTKFPYDTFYWKGIDGTSVLTHFNCSTPWPDVRTVMEYVAGSGDAIKERSVSNMRLLSYGHGDGGGGPQFEMIEMARRIKDLEGVPRTDYIHVSDFMKKLEETSENVSVHRGELYLEIHRGTLTNQHNIKKNNRLAERALHDYEYVTVRNAVRHGEDADSARIAPLTEKLLKNQFHDVLPGTSIPRVHKESIEETGYVIDAATKGTRELLEKDASEAGKRHVTVVNTLSFERNDTVYISDVKGLRVKGDYPQQRFVDMDGDEKLAVLGVTVPGFGSAVLELEASDVGGGIGRDVEGGVENGAGGGSAFIRKGTTLITPYADITFDERMYVSSYVDRNAKRELKGEGYALNTLLIAEDVPTYWDNWDVDADLELKFKDQAKLIGSEVVGDGPVEYRIRNHYQLSDKTDVLQDMVIAAGNPSIRFETRMNWQDHHRFLKAAFNTSINTDMARQEIQYGYITRSTSRNTEADKAKFEVCNHKYTDLSETRYGISLLNDCKYGMTVNGSNMWLSLHKGGRRPDYEGDLGVHECIYTFMPHNGGFGVPSVARPAYELNYPVTIIKGRLPMDAFIEVCADNVIIETIKPCEDAERAYIARLYEAEGTYTSTRLVVPHDVREVVVTNMIEDEREALDKENMELGFRPFEIKTVKIRY